MADDRSDQSPSQGIIWMLNESLFYSSVTAYGTANSPVILQHAAAQATLLAIVHGCLQHHAAVASACI